MSKFKHYMQIVQNESGEHNFRINSIIAIINNKKRISLYDNGNFTKLKYSQPEKLTKELKKLIVNYNLTIRGINKEDIVEKIEKDKNFKNNLKSIMDEFANLYDSAAHDSDENISSGSNSLSIEIDITQGSEFDMEIITIKIDHNDDNLVIK